MIKLTLLDKSKWVLYFMEEDSEVVTDHRGAVKTLLFMGVKKAEILLAMEEMYRQKHDGSEFGVFGKFVRTFDTATLKQRAA